MAEQRERGQAMWFKAALTMVGLDHRLDHRERAAT